MLALDGKAVVIIGGTTGLGLSAARACLREGADVMVTGRNIDSVVAAQAELGQGVFCVSEDAVDPASAPRVIAACLDRFGRFDALYHVAGGSGRKMGDGPLHEITDAGWQATIALNQASCFNSARAACRVFWNRKTPGSILLMGSVLGYSPSPRFFATHAYATAKAAIIGLATAAAAYYASQNIRFNVIAPGLVETPMARRAANDPVIQQFIRTKQPLDGGRIGRADDLDAAVVFLLSDAAKFITGQVLAVDGGWSITEGQIPPTEAQA